MKNTEINKDYIEDKYLKTRKFHSGYRLKEIYSNEELTDVAEIHFIEIPKLEKESDENEILESIIY